MDEYGFGARLRHLEYILFGQQEQYSNTTLNEATVPERLEALQKELNNVYRQNKPIKDFIRKYEAHSEKLNPVTSTFMLERENLASDVKVELLLNAQEDIEKFAKEVKQIKDLEYVINGSDLAAVDTLEPKLAPLEMSHTDQVTELHRLTKQITDFMERYNGTVNTLSEIFISWDNILTGVETHLLNLERQRSQS
ncbi:hypothetical protein BDF20DRAFT_863600 [Mycotypha africana]|uniref:uncharacterized protein n=1 Tax=Mycotypha africana TaxID=64632 RepID=UPI002301EE23|nr:uncharacterized protein BDF20DRAFT_863600 [Mycotypha africana]KAI8981853.1 hypothetical protein BDF20DRAFT_863600 [Mycotypha africana]